MISFLIGYDPVSEKDIKEEAWVHINLWEKKETNSVIIDFGILVNDVKKIKAIKIYSPYAIKDVKDISTLLKEHKELITAVFNENYQHNVSEKGEEFIIQPHKGDPFVLSPIKEEDLIIKQNDNLVILNIKKVKLASVNRSYFRIRITLSKESCSNFIFAHESKGSRFSDFFTSTEIIDFRLNDSRSGSNIDVGNFFHIRSVNYFILRDPSEIIIYHGNAMRNSRYLEPDIWEKYGLENGLLAYHLYRKAERIENKGSGNSKFSYEYINHFSELVRFQCQKPRFWIIILSVIGMGCISGFLGNLLFALVKGLCK